MRSRVRVWLTGSTALMVLCGYMALVSVRGYSTLLLAIPVALLLLMPLGEWLDRTSAAYRAISRAVTIAFGCFIPLLWIRLGMMNGVIALVVFIQAYTLLHAKEERNYYHLYLMALFLLLAATVQSPEPVIGVVMALFLIAGVWAFLSLRIHEELGAHENGRPAEIVPLRGEAPGAAAARSPFDLGLIVSVTVLSFAAIGFTVLIFVLTPGIEAGILGASNAPIAQTGIPQTVDLDGGTLLAQDPTPVMHVTFPDEPGGQPAGLRDLYWRITTLPRFSSDSWERRGLLGHLEPDTPSLFPTEMRLLHDQDPLEASRGHRAGARLVRQWVYMDDVPDQGVPVLDLAVSVRAEGSPRSIKLSWDGNQDFTVNLTARGARRLTYEAVSEVHDPAPDDLRSAPQDYAALMAERDYQELTYHQLLPQTVEQAAQVAAGASNAYDKAVALSNWLSGPAFLYTTDIPALPDQFAIDAFVNTTRRGHCELFASALALMLRSQGVPCRVVSGYRGGEWSPADGSYTVRASMAHLWVEVFFPRHGWVVFDPSPQPGAEDLGAMARTRRFFSWLGLRAKMFWYQEVVGFDRNVPMALLRDATLGVVRWFQQPPGDALPGEAAAEPAYGGIPWGSLALGVLAVGLLALLLRLRRRMAQRRMLTADQARAARLFVQLQRRLARMGIDVRGCTAEELHAMAAGRDGIDGERLAAVVQAYNDARFGRRPMGPARYRALRAALRALRTAPA